MVPIVVYLIGTIAELEADWHCVWLSVPVADVKLIETTELILVIVIVWVVGHPVVVIGIVNVPFAVGFPEIVYTPVRSLAIVKPVGKFGGIIPLAPPPIVNRIGTIGPFWHTDWLIELALLRNVIVAAGLISKVIVAVATEPQLPWVEIV